MASYRLLYGNRNRYTELAKSSQFTYLFMLNIRASLRFARNNFTTTTETTEQILPQLALGQNDRLVRELGS